MNCIKPQPWTEQDDSLIRAQYPIQGPNYCAEQLRRSKSAIVTRAYRLRVKMTQTYVENVRMDRLKTPQFAYLLGYLWADGCLYTKDRCMKMTIQKRDGDTLHEILDYTGIWKKHLRTKEDRYYWAFSITDKRFCDLLTDLGYDSKSTSSFMPVIGWLGRDLAAHFVHGFFDGDGSIMEFSRGPRGISFAGRHDYDWDDFLTLLARAGIETARVFVSKKRGVPSSSAVVFHRQIDILRFYRTFIHGHTVGLPRKMSAFVSFVQYIRHKIEKKRSVQCRKGSFYPLVSHRGKMSFVGTFKSLKEAYIAMDKWDTEHGTDRFVLGQELAKLDA